MNKTLMAQLRYILSSAGWLLVLLVFLPTEWWDRAAENVKRIGPVAAGLGGTIAVVAHIWSASSKRANVREKVEEALEDKEHTDFLVRELGTPTPPAPPNDSQKKDKLK